MTADLVFLAKLGNSKIRKLIRKFQAQNKKFNFYQK